MKLPHWKSYLTGVASGIIVLLVGTSIHGLITPKSPTINQLQDRQQFRDRGAQGRPTGGTMDENRIKDMAERFGMTEAELQAELDAGKTLPEIATEHDVEFGASRIQQQGSGSLNVSSSSQSSVFSLNTH